MVMVVVHYFYRQNQMLSLYFVLLLRESIRHYVDQYLFDPKLIHSLLVLRRVLIVIDLKKKKSTTKLAFACFIHQISSE